MRSDKTGLGIINFFQLISTEEYKSISWFQGSMGESNMDNPAVIALYKKYKAFYNNKNLIPIKNVAFKFGEFQSVRNEFLSP